MTTDLQKHLESIQIASSELLAMQKRTAHPALVQHQYIGTVLDNTISLLTAPANSLDRGHRYLTFTDSQKWLSLMQAVHRSFLSSIHTATEKGLVDYCNTRGSVVESQIRSDAVVHLNELAKLVGDEHRALKKLRRLIGKAHPSFDDYLNSALEVSCFTTKQKTVWRRFFKALSTVRNKVSHSDTTLSDAEQEALKTGGLGAMVSSKGELMVNPQMYHQLATFLLDFFDLLLDSKKPI